MRKIKKFNENFYESGDSFDSFDITGPLFQGVKDFIRDPSGKKRRAEAEKRSEKRSEDRRKHLQEYADTVDVCIEYNESTEEFEHVMKLIENGLIEDVKTSKQTNKAGFSHHFGNPNKENYYEILFKDGTEIIIAEGREFDIDGDYHVVRTMLVKDIGDYDFHTLGNRVIPNGATNFGMWGENTGYISQLTYQEIVKAAESH
jgi:hypothetical protein